MDPQGHREHIDGVYCSESRKRARERAREEKREGNEKKKKKERDASNRNLRVVM